MAHPKPLYCLAGSKHEGRLSTCLPDSRKRSLLGSIQAFAASVDTLSIQGRTGQRGDRTWGLGKPYSTEQTQECVFTRIRNVCFLLVCQFSGVQTGCGEAVPILPMASIPLVF